MVARWARLSRWAGVMVAMLFCASTSDAQEQVDQKIVTKLHRLSHNEMAMARMGQDEGLDGKVKTLAAKVLDDHQALDRELLAYAEGQEMNMEAVGRASDAGPYGSLAMASLNTAARGAEFDYQFALRMVRDHQGMIAVAEEARRLARDYELRQLIGRQMGTLWEHLSMAEALVASLPEPPPRIVTPRGEPNGISRTQTGADEPPPQAVINVGP